MLLKQPCALRKNLHYYSSALLGQLTTRFYKNNRSTSTDRYTRHFTNARYGLLCRVPFWHSLPDIRRPLGGRSLRLLLRFVFFFYRHLTFTLYNLTLYASPFLLTATLPLRCTP